MDAEFIKLEVQNLATRALRASEDSIDSWVACRMWMIHKFIQCMQSKNTYDTEDLKFINELDREVYAYHRKIYNINMPPLGEGRGLETLSPHKKKTAHRKKV